MPASVQMVDPRTRPRTRSDTRPGAREKDGLTSVRRCIATGELRPKAELIRFVADPSGTVVPDLAGRLPGRGLWLSPRREHLERACARNLFAKAAKAPLRVPDDLPTRVEGLLSRRCLELIGLAKRAGQAVSGFQRVASLLASGGVAVLLAAVDTAADGRSDPTVRWRCSAQYGRHDARPTGRVRSRAVSGDGVDVESLRPGDA